MTFKTNKMTRCFITFSLLLLNSSFLWANKPTTNFQNSDNSTWEFYCAINEQILGKQKDNHKKNPFSPTIGALQQLYKTLSLKRNQLGVGDMSATVSIRKPLIYDSVRNIEKYYSKKRKQQKLTLEDKADLEHILRVAIATLDLADHGNFEVHIGINRKCVECQIDLYQKVILQSIY